MKSCVQWNPFVGWKDIHLQRGSNLAPQKYSIGNHKVVNLFSGIFNHAPRGLYGSSLRCTHACLVGHTQK